MNKMTEPLDITNLTQEDRDKLLLGMAAGVIDLCGAVNDLTAAISILLNLMTNGMRNQEAAA